MQSRAIKRKEVGSKEGQLEDLMFRLVNKERREAGRQALVKGPLSLFKAARSHAQNMAEKGFFSHFDPIHAESYQLKDRLLKVNLLPGKNYRCCGENLGKAAAVDKDMTKLLYEAHKGLMNSPGHKKNILSPDFKSIGIGVVKYQELGEASREIIKKVNGKVTQRRVIKEKHWIPGILVTQIFLG